MAFSVVMPALEMAQETGRLLGWKKKEGDRVRKGEPLFEIETDKAVMEIEAPADGVLAGVTGTVGAEILVGQTIAWIVSPGEKPPEENKFAPPAARRKIESHSAPAVGNASEACRAQSARVSPKARRLAKELGVDIATVHGTGPGGEILASDVQGVAGPPVATSPARKSAAPEVPGTLGRLMAERTTQSWTTIPHFFVSRDIEITALSEYRANQTAEIERVHSIRISYTDLLVALTARVLLKHPRLNSGWTEEGIPLRDHVNMGVAIAVNEGVVAAVIQNAHTTSLAEIALQRRDLAERARGGRLRPADIAGATFTISNLGMYHLDSFSAIIVPSQAAILAVGSIADRVIAREGKPTIRPMVTLTLSCDHRVVDGASAAIFLNDLAGALGDPKRLL